MTGEKGKQARRQAQSKQAQSKQAAKRLGTYRAKRDPSKTPEPMGSEGVRSGRSAGSGGRTPRAPRFVIQEHHARALHWDFRLEHDGVYVSWALPKGLPLDPSTNHLAVHTEDHPLEYGEFQGEIPKGEYGGGQVTIWDHGTYDTEKWSEREVMVVLHGGRSNGRYVLFATGGKNWMIHRMDPAPEGFEPMPDTIEPMLAKAVESMPEGDDWAYEFDWDGERAILFVDGGRVRVAGSSEKDHLRSVPELRAIGEFLGSRPAVLDGLLVELEGARPSYLAFDLLYLDGRLLLTNSYDKRRAKLESLGLAGDAFATSPSFSGVAHTDVLAAARQNGLKGIVAKRRNSPYTPGKVTGDWVALKKTEKGAVKKTEKGAVKAQSTPERVNPDRDDRKSRRPAAR